MLQGSDIVHQIERGCDRDCVFSASGRPDHVNWGLPVYMGFSGKEYTVPYTVTGPLPTFYYYDKNTDPLSYNPFHHATTPGLADATIHVLTPCGQLNLSSEVYYYLEIDGLNMVDELLPFNNDAYAVTTGTSTGIIKSIFSKRAILSNIDMQYRSGVGEAKDIRTTTSSNETNQCEDTVPRWEIARLWFGPI